MGRHSAPDDDEPDDAAVATLDPDAAPEAPGALGRHARPDAVADSAESSASTATEPAEAAEGAVPAVPAVAEKPPKKGGTRADLRLLRESGMVRASCLGVVLIAFIGYTVVMLAISAMDSYLIWLWIPIVLSGVLVGAVLDLAHRRTDRPSQSP